MRRIVSTIGKRLASEVDAFPGGVSAAAAAIGVARNTVYNWIEKGNVPADKLAALGEAGIDHFYVMTGQRMDLHLATQDAERQEHLRERVIPSAAEIDRMVRNAAFVGGGATVGAGHPAEPDRDEAALLRDYRRCSLEDQATLRQIAGRFARNP